MEALEVEREELRRLVEEQGEQLRQFRALFSAESPTLRGGRGQVSSPKREAHKEVVVLQEEKREIDLNAGMDEEIVIVDVPQTMPPPLMPTDEKKAKAGMEKEKPMEKQQKKKTSSDDINEDVEEWRVIQIGAPVRNVSSKGATKFISVVRGKARANLPEADDCAMCKEYYDALAAETGQARDQLVRECTRHRSMHPQVTTPPGFWDVGWD